jgi:hypothetical protein
VAGLVLAVPTAASGVEFLPRGTEHFADHAACVAALEAHIARDLARRAPRVAGADGRVREVRVAETRIDRLGPGRASHGSEILVLEGAPDPASGRLRIQPRFELINRDCEGAVMITGGMRATLPPVLE